MLELGLKTLLAYWIGSLVGALLVGGLRGVDIRELGSGNAGGTNALRTRGFGFAAATVAIDVGKGWLAAAWLPGLAWPGVAPDAALDRGWLAVACAAAAVAGHVWPQFHGFRGGKGGATLAGALAALAPDVLPAVLLAWLVVAALSGLAGLATMTAAATVPFALYGRAPEELPLVAFGAAMTLFLLFTHRANIARMRAGAEPRLGALWLLRPRGRS